jgi:hypothetical protein
MIIKRKTKKKVLYVPIKEEDIQHTTKKNVGVVKKRVHFERKNG